MQHLFLPLEDELQDLPGRWVAIPRQQGTKDLKAIVTQLIPTAIEWASSNCTVMTVTREGLNIKGLDFSANQLMEEIYDDRMVRRLKRSKPFFHDLPPCLGDMPHYASPITFTALTMHADEFGLRPAPNKVSCCFQQDTYQLFRVPHPHHGQNLTAFCSLRYFVDAPPE